MPSEAPEETTEQSAEEPAAEEAPAEDTAPTDEQSADELPVDETQTEETQTEEAPAEETPTEETQVKEPEELSEPARALKEETGQPMQTQAVEERLEPAAVVSDDFTEAEQTTLQAQEEERREDARDHRLELLGAAAVGVAVGALIPALGGRVVEDQGDRIIVERDDGYYIHKDESSLLRYGEAEFRVERLSHGRTRETVTRVDGTQVVTIRDTAGYVLFRSRILPDGREYVLIDNLHYDPRDRYYDVPDYRVDIPRDHYIVPAGQVGYETIYETFAAPPVVQLDHGYSLRQVRESEEVRDMVRRVDLDTITFSSGSAVVRESQVPLLEDLARASIALIEQDPSTVLLIEGHTDAVGSEVSNLALSDRRAETVGRILSDVYDVPPEKHGDPGLWRAVSEGRDRGPGRTQPPRHAPQHHTAAERQKKQ
ncbi:OmpA family protein [Roseibium salinum]|nr:OmpA family protein [Roseibium salinum]